MSESRIINRIKIGVVLFLVIILSACDPNYKNIDLSGYVQDSSNNAPLYGANVNVILWVYDEKISESISLKQSILTDAHGYYHFHFLKGEAIDISIIKKNYIKKNISFTIDNTYNQKNFTLARKN